MSKSRVRQPAYGLPGAWTTVGEVGNNTFQRIEGERHVNPNANGLRLPPIRQAGPLWWACEGSSCVGKRQRQV